jgi:hypothetical protein
VADGDIDVEFGQLAAVDFGLLRPTWFASLAVVRAVGGADLLRFAGCMRYRMDAARQCCYKVSMNALRTIVYVSSSTHDLTTADLEALLADARAFNRQHQLTGVLLHIGPHFMQCLEGAPDDVGKAYERIKRSSQHKDIVEYMDCEVAERTFGSWEMGSAKSATSELLALSTAEWSRATQQASTFESPAGLKMLKVFWNMRQQAA